MDSSRSVSLPSVSANGIPDSLRRSSPPTVATGGSAPGTCFSVGFPSDRGSVQNSRCSASLSSGSVERSVPSPLQPAGTPTAAVRRGVQISSHSFSRPSFAVRGRPSDGCIAVPSKAVSHRISGSCYFFGNRSTTAEESARQRLCSRKSFARAHLIGFRRRFTVGESVPDLRGHHGSPELAVRGCTARYQQEQRPKESHRIASERNAAEKRQEKS